MGIGDTVGIGCAPCQSAAHYTAAAIACSGASRLHDCLCKPVSARLSEAGPHRSCLYNSKQSVAIAEMHKHIIAFVLYLGLLQNTTLEPYGHWSKICI